MPVAALAATLMLALPATDAVAGAPSPREPDAGATAPRPAEADGTTQVLPLADQGGQAIVAPRRPKQPLARLAGVQVAELRPSRLQKPGSKARVVGSLPRGSQDRFRQAVASDAPSPPAAELLLVAAGPSGEAAAERAGRADEAAAGRPGPAGEAAAGRHGLHAPRHRPPRQTGVASYYAQRFNGRLMANGERFDPHSDSIAHRSLPFGTRVRIVNVSNGRSVIGTVRDRGPYARGRLLDVSPRIAHELDMIRSGIARVAVFDAVRDPVEIAEAP